MIRNGRYGQKKVTSSPPATPRRRSKSAGSNASCRFLWTSPPESRRGGAPREREKFRSLSRTSGDRRLRDKKTGSLVYVSPSYENITGYPAKMRSRISKHFLMHRPEDRNIISRSRTGCTTMMRRWTWSSGSSGATATVSGSGPVPTLSVMNRGRSSVSRRIGGTSRAQGIRGGNSSERTTIEHLFRSSSRRSRHPLGPGEDDTGERPVLRDRRI